MSLLKTHNLRKTRPRRCILASHDVLCQPNNHTNNMHCEALNVDDNLRRRKKTDY